MSHLKSFLDRWSQRKRAATEDVAAKDAGTQAAEPASVVGLSESESAETSPVQTRSAQGLGVDLTKLPPIDSITAESDIRAFLAPGIPPELTRAALRRAWAVDPKIREFVGLAENSWDFNAPGAIGGFGPLEMTDALRRQIVQFVGRNVASEASDASAPPSVEAQEGRTAVETSAISNAGDGDGPTRQAPTSHAEPVQSGAKLPEQFRRSDKVQIATQCEPERREGTEPTAKGPHGRALPK